MIINLFEAEAVRTAVRAPFDSNFESKFEQTGKQLYKFLQRSEDETLFEVAFCVDSSWCSGSVRAPDLLA